MKSSMGKLRKFAALHHRADAKEKPDVPPSSQLDELAVASKDMQAMKGCYDSLLSAAAATANSAYEFSESLQEMGTCLLEKTALNGDEEAGKLLAMLGKVQHEIQKMVDSYRSHIFLTITNPSESFLNELRNVEEMRKQCEEKRDAYEYMISLHKEKGKSKGGKGETLALQQLQSAREEYEEEANLCVFRLKSLKQGQSRSLLTQAARHHMAQLNFFRKGLKSLEAVDPHIKKVTEEQHIDYQVSALDDEVEDGEDDGEDSYNDRSDGELSFDYRKNNHGVDTSASGNSMEVDDPGLPYPAQTNEVNLVRNQGDIHASNREHHRRSSYSAPIFAEKKLDPSDKVRPMLRLPTRSPYSYVLPTPAEGKGAAASQIKATGQGGPSHSSSHSSPLEQKKHERRPSVDVKPGKHTIISPLPPPLTDGFVSDMEKFKRQAFSGPLTSKPVTKKPVLSASGPISASDLPHLVSGADRSVQSSSPPKLFSCASPPPPSSPKINELHELPRPPGDKPVKSAGLVGHSAPLINRNQESSAAHKIPSTASPLPAPPTPLIVPRSFSIPSSSDRAMALDIGKILEPPHFMSIEVPSPPLTPISLGKAKAVTSIAAAASHSGPIRGRGMT